jgi:hypothetical protein
LFPVNSFLFFCLHFCSFRLFVCIKKKHAQLGSFLLSFFFLFDYKLIYFKSVQLFIKDEKLEHSSVFFFCLFMYLCNTN